MDVYPPAADYLNHADRSKMTLVEAFRNMQIDGDKSLENGELEAAESNGHDHNSEEQNGEDGSQEELVVVDADSNDGAVLVNGSEPEEEWGWGLMIVGLLANKVALSPKLVNSLVQIIAEVAKGGESK